VATLDLHAHITQRMVENANALVSFAHYPHDDTYSTGERGARLLLDAVRGTTIPTMAVAKAPMVVSACNSQTFGSGPMVRLAVRARELEKRSGVLSVSCVPVQPHLDVEGMGCTAVVVTDDDRELAESTARSLAGEFWARRAEFTPEVLPISEAVERGRSYSGGPVLLVDASDCAGGGAPGDSVALLGELLNLGLTETAYAMVVDPDSVNLCVGAGIGNDVALDLGYRSDPSWGRPVRVSGTVRTLSDGQFRYTGGPYGGTSGSMGVSAVLQIGTIEVLIMSLPTYDWADEQYRVNGMDVRRAKFVGVKNPMNYRLAYKDIASASFVVDTPGPTTADIRRLKFRKMRRPFYPFDDEIPNLPITMVTN
jgi:microcystin degradation protein MlrC